MNNSWNLDKLKKQAIKNQEFDDYVLNESNILNYENLEVLDIGCSNGFKTELLFGKYNNIKHITGIDVDNVAILEAKEKFKNNKRYTFEVKDINKLEDKDKYDIINLSYVLQHLENPREVLEKLKNNLTQKGVIIIKVPDDSFKFCYPDEENLLHQIFDLYENEIMRKQDITKFTDRYIGKKVKTYLSENGYKNIKLYYSITDTIEKNKEERLNFFESSIAFRNANNKNNVSKDIVKKMNDLLDELKKKFEDDKFYYTMTVLYYIANK
jgi:2-polyprenyl-3-methyl-5-hydroxy-6-metoxy-1,4-benzoquinol methylase